MRILPVIFVLLLLGGCATTEPGAYSLAERGIPIFVLGDGCPLDPGVINISKNGVIKWRIDRKSPGYRLVDEFEITFAQNPTGCGDSVTQDRNKNLTCTVKDDADANAFFCYGITITTTEDKRCHLDPTIYVNDSSMMQRETAAMCEK